MEGTNGRRVHFSVLATTTPKLLVDKGSRQCVVFYNSAAVGVYLGYSGTGANGLSLGANSAFHDLFSSDEWWVTASSSSGTVSGYVVI